MADRITYIISYTLLLIFTTLPDRNYCFSYLRERIPNSHLVPNVCRNGETWDGVGHVTAEGGGPRNPFGRDFKLHGLVWNKDICEADSDSDGKSNGEELGDPGCEWAPGTLSNNSLLISHPGICEPIESDHCKVQNSWLKCLTAANCPSLQQPDVESMEIRLDPTAVPAEETTYMCQAFRLQFLRNETIHVIGMEAILVNKDLIHHIAMYGCDNQDRYNKMGTYSSPKSCIKLGAGQLCRRTLMDWNVGNPMDCYDGDYGIQLGKDGHKHIMIEVHWNNQLLHSDLIDSSGLKLYYTRKLRTYNSATLFVGSPYLELPPGREAVVQPGGCNSYCTEKVFRQKIYIVKVLPHMHHMGRAMSLVIKRNGQVIRQLYNISDYNFKTPEFIEFDPPVELLPGDEMVTSCTFNTMGRNRYVFYEAASNDEMCLGVLTYYPMLRYGITTCITVDDVGICEKYYSPTGCVKKVTEIVQTIGDRLEGMCDPDGLVCWPACHKVIMELSDHVCFQPGKEFYIKTVLMQRLEEKGKRIIQMLGSCYNNNIHIDQADIRFSASGMVHKGDLIEMVQTNISSDMDELEDIHSKTYINYKHNKDFLNLLKKDMEKLSTKTDTVVEGISSTTTTKTSHRNQRSQKLQQKVQDTN